MHTIPGENPLDDWALAVDCGDVPLTPFDNTYALKQLEKAHKVCPGLRSTVPAL